MPIGGCGSDIRTPVFGDLRRLRNLIMHERVVLSDDAASKLEAGQEVQAAEVLQLTRRGGLDLDAYDAPVSGFED